MNKASFFLFLALLAIANLRAQGPNEGYILEAEAASHLIQHPAPVYPPIAKAAHVQGSVLLHLDVDATGKVTAVEVIGGPELLRAAAISAAERYTYLPFSIDGRLAPVKVAVSVPFSLGIPDATYKTDQQIGQAYFPKSDQCRAALATKGWPAAVTACKDALDIALRFPDPNSRTNELRGAYQEYGSALFYSGDAKTALPLLGQAIAIARSSLTPDQAEYASVFLSQALAEHALQMKAQAEADYSTAEASYRQAIQSLPDLAKQYRLSLSRALAFHAVLESQTGHLERMKALATEALQLNPNAFAGIVESPK